MGRFFLAVLEKVLESKDCIKFLATLATCL